MKTAALILALASSLFALAPFENEEEAAIERACRDYLDAFYQCEPDLIDRSVHTALRKIGYGRWEAGAEYKEFPMTFESLKQLASRWNAEKKRDLTDAPREVVILDRLDTTACAKLTAHWGIDYFHLAKYEGKWKIINVLWQTHPPEGWNATVEAKAERR